MTKKSDLFAGLAQDILHKRKKMAQPSFVKPMLATLTDNYFSNDDWLFEHKYDGERCLAFKKNGKVQLLSRNHKSMNRAYPELVAALEKQSADNFVIDGEIISKNKKGVSDFELLQGRIHLQNELKIALRTKKNPINYCIFDLMYVGGYDIQKLPLIARKKILKKLLHFNTMLVFSKHKVDDGITYFKYACKHHWEGLIAKFKDGEYVGRRSPNWLKFKCIFEQELVIGGYTTPKGSRSYFGALLVGYYENRKLMYAGKVGTGYSEGTLKMLGTKLHKITIKKCPFANYDESTRDVHWVKPELVGEFGFANWTRDSKLRVGRYKGLRDDKAAKDVVKETPKAIGPKR